MSGLRAGRRLAVHGKETASQRQQQSSWQRDDDTDQTVRQRTVASRIEEVLAAAVLACIAERWPSGRAEAQRSAAAGK